MQEKLTQVFGMFKVSLSVRSLAGVLTLIFFSVSIATLPVLDFSEPNVLFYLQHLTLSYYVCLVFSLMIAVLFGKGFVAILAAIIFAFSLLWTPSFMLVQSWPMDVYPFLSQSVSLARNGRIGTGVISETPGLGLSFGSLLLLTGIDPFFLGKMYPAFFLVVFVVLMYSIAKQIGVERKPVIAPLLSVAVMWPNEIHFSRQCLSIIFYVGSWFLLLRLMKKRDRRIFFLLLSQVIVLVLSHPGSPLFLIANLIAVLLFGLISRRIQPKDQRLITSAIFSAGFFWIAWNIYTLSESKGVRVFEQITERAVSSIIRNPTEAPGAAKIFVGYTSAYSNVIDIRLAVTGFVCLSAILLSAAIYKFYRKNKLLLSIISWSTTNVFSGGLFLYAGLPFMARPALFSFVAWAPLGAWTYQVLDAKRKKVMKFAFLSAFVVVPAILLPIIKYAPIPFLFASSQELKSATLIGLCRNGSSLIYLASLPPYSYSYIVYGTQETTSLLGFGAWYIPGEGIDRNLVYKFPILVTNRVMTRDAFWEYTPSMYDIVANLTCYAELRNKAYDSGWPYCALVPLPDSTR